jgi:hypothetical protein
VGFPNIDRGNGGSLKGMLAAFDTLIAAAGPSYEGTARPRPDHQSRRMIAHKRMAIALRDQVAKMIAEGRRRSRSSRQRSPISTRSRPATPPAPATASSTSSTRS